MSHLPPDTAAPASTVPPRTDPVTRFFGGPPVWVLVKLAMLSIVIGVILFVLGLDLFGLLRAIEDLFYEFFDNIWDALAKLAEWFVLGAVIVFPIWLVARVLKLGAR